MSLANTAACRFLELRLPSALYCTGTYQKSSKASLNQMRLLRFVRRPKARAAVAAPAQPAPRTSRRRALRKWLAPRVFVLAAAVAPIVPRLPHYATPVVVMHAAAPHAKQLPGGIDGETPEVIFLEAASKPRLLDRAAASIKRRTKALPELFGRQASKARRVAAQTIAPRDDESKGRSYSGAPSFAATAAEKVGPAVVRVDVERGGGESGFRAEYSHASGFVYDAERALAITNAHVVHGARTVGVVLSTGERCSAAVLGRATRGCFNRTSTLECLSDRKGVKKRATTFREPEKR